jgi:hypothetical protein
VSRDWWNHLILISRTVLSCEAEIGTRAHVSVARRSYRRQVSRSVTIGAAFFYAGLFIAAALLASGSSWPAPVACVAGGLLIGFYFADVRLLAIGEAYRAKGFPPEEIQ